MKISVVIPAYNEERYVGACLKSIFLGRIPELAEVIVVNNASTDNTANVVARFPEDGNYLSDEIYLGRCVQDF